jgi:hypothetical protein
MDDEGEIDQDLFLPEGELGEKIERLLDSHNNKDTG